MSIVNKKVFCFRRNSQKKPVFTKELCYRVFRELINFMECNFVNLHFYTEETMSALYEELVSRIHSSVPPKRIPFDGSIAWVEDVDLSQFHLVTPDECEMEGDVLLKINSTQPKIALNYPIRAIGDHAFSYSAIFEEIILPQGLEEVTGNPKLEKIGKNLFQDCVKLKNNPLQ